VKGLKLTAYPSDGFPYADKRTKLLEPFLADTGHQRQILYSSKRAMGRTVCHNSSSQHGSNAREMFKLG
jgi:hypothetical protein